MTLPDTAPPDTTRPDTALPDTALPDLTVVDALVCPPATACTSFLKSGGGCVAAHKPAGAKCDDGKSGTIKDACDGKGACAGTPLPTKGLVAHYPFTGDAKDASGTGNHGSVSGATLTADRFGTAQGAYTFNGKSDHIVVKDHTSLHLNDFTFTAWVKMTTTSGGNYVLEKDVVGTGTQDYEWLTSSGKTNGRIGIKGNNYDVPSKTSVATGTWRFVAFRRAGSELSTWIGTVKETMVTAPTGTLTGGKQPLTIGSGWQGTGYFTGALDDVRIYNRALSAQEIALLQSHK